MSPRFSYLSRKSSIRPNAHGKIKNASVTITTKIGHANRYKGLISAVSPLPLPNQMTISLSRNIRVSTLNTARRRLNDKIVGMSESTVYPMMISTSVGLNVPRDASPTRRISVMVMTTVTNTTRVAPKLRASSFRMEEWNNMAAKEKPNYEL